MIITLDLLQQYYACKPAIHAFKKKFSPTFRAPAEDVFAALAEMKQTEWLIWLVQQLPGFSQAVNGQTHGNYTVAADGSDLYAAMKGIVIACGNAIVTGMETAAIYALGNAQINAAQHCRVHARHNAKVLATDHVTVVAYDEVDVDASGNVSVKLYNQATLKARNYVTANVCHDTKTVAYGHVVIRAYEGARVDAYDQVTILLDEYRFNPIINLHSPQACVVDRRMGYVTLINGPLLADSDEGKARLEIKMQPGTIPTRPLSLYP